MYHIYTTEGIVLKRANFGEANIILYILTQDLGLIIASAQAARLGVSKLRPSLQEYSLSIFSVVKGKNGWKVTNAIAKENFFFSYPEYTHGLLGHVVSLLIKMIPGEERNVEVYNVIKGGYKHLDLVTEDKIEDMECLIVLRILFCLGYVVLDDETRYFLDDINKWSEESLSNMREKRKTIIAIINKSLKASQL